MKISIVTICYNEEKNISATIESVLNQTSTNIQYIICDGKSTDETLNIAESYRKAFEDRGIEYIVTSQKDGGIYFGMNNGIDLAEEEYTIFINGGDLLYSETIIEDILNNIESMDTLPDVVYGDVMCIERDFTYIYKGDHTLLDSGMNICHQAILVRTDVLKQNKFNTNYRIIADYEMMLRLRQGQKSFKRIEVTFAMFRVGGVSTTNVKQCTKEYCSVWNEYKIPYNKFKVVTGNWKHRIAYSIKMKMPKKLWAWWNIKIKKKKPLEDIKEEIRRQK